MDDGAPNGGVLRRIDHLLGEFSAQPLATGLFEELVELLRQAGRFGALAGVYECRIDALESAEEQAPLLSELGAVLEQELASASAGLERYRQAHELAPRDAAALAGMRRCYAALGDARQALSMAEREADLLVRPRDRADLLAEMGQLLASLGETEGAESRYREALRLDAEHDLALAGLSALAVQRGDAQEAVRWLERRTEGLIGPARAQVLEELAGWLPDSECERKRELLRQVVAELPQRRSALEAWIRLEREAGDWPRVDELRHLLLPQLSSEAERLRLALEAATLQLDDGASPERATRWAEIAHGLAPDDGRVQHLRATLFRRTGQPGGLLHALEALDRLEGVQPERSLEIARLYESSGRFDRAADQLKRLLAEFPNEAGALCVLDRCLGALGQSADRLKVLERRIRLAQAPIERAALETRLGDLLLHEMADADSALLAYRRALEQVPSHRPAIERLLELMDDDGQRAELTELLLGLCDRIGEARARARIHCDLARLELRSDADPAIVRGFHLRALDADPSCLEALAGLRTQARERSDLSTLLEACERELQLELPESRRVEVLVELIDAAERLGDLPRALLAAAEWAALVAGIEPHRRLAALARRCEDPAREVEALEALELRTRDALERSNCLERLGDLCLEQPDPSALQRALERYRSALRALPRPELRAKLSDLYRRLGALPELAASLRAELTEAPVGIAAELRLELAQTLVELGDRSGAEQQLEANLHDDPRDRSSARLLDRLLAEAGRHEARVEWLRARLAAETSGAERRRIACTLAELLLEHRSDPAASRDVLSDFVQPGLETPAEQLYLRALEAAGDTEPLLHWLARCEPFAATSERCQLLMRMARLLHREGRSREALACLRRCELSLPADELERIARPLLSLVHGLENPELEVEILGELMRVSPDAATRATLGLECARLLAEALERPRAACTVLETLPADAALSATELRQLRRLSRRVRAPRPWIRALEALCAGPDLEPELRLELADLLAEGPLEVRNLDRAEALLEELCRSAASPHTIEAARFRRSVLFEQESRPADLARELEAQLSEEHAEGPRREALVLRLARLYLDQGELEAALELLDREAEGPGPTEAIDGLLFETLERCDRPQALLELCERRSRSGSAVTQATWLERWLGLLERQLRPAEECLPVVERLLERTPDATALQKRRLALLRAREDPERLARVLEEWLDDPRATANLQRGPLVQELVELYENSLGNPEQALDRLVRESRNDARWIDPGLRCAARLGDLDREIELLELQLRLAGAEGEPLASVRRLALAYCERGRDSEAVPLLWRVLEHNRGDRSIAEALTRLVGPEHPRDERLRLLELRFDLETASRRTALALEAFELSRDAGDGALSLLWVRRWEALEALPGPVLDRWVELERSHGDRPTLLRALRAQREASDCDPEARAVSFASEAALELELGRPLRALEFYARARELAAPPRLEWLRELERLCDEHGELEGRLEALDALAQHPQASSAEQTRAHGIKAELLAADPQRRDQAIASLRWLVDADVDADPGVSPGAAAATAQDGPTRIERKRKLLELYEQSGRMRDWASLAEDLIGELPADQALELRFDYARKTSEELGLHDVAIEAWRALRAERPADSEAALALCELYREPGYEVERAEMLEACARERFLAPREAWLEAGLLRWNSLRDAAGALDAIERALTEAPRDAMLHRLRAELARELDRPTAEIDSLEALLSAEPAAPAAAERWLRLGVLHANRRDGHADAGRAARAAVALLPLDPDPVLGVCVEDPGDEPAEQAIYLDEGDAESDLAVRLDGHTQARRILESIGDWAGAAEILEQEIVAVGGEHRIAALRRLSELSWDELRQAEATCSVLKLLADHARLSDADHRRWSEALAAVGRWSEALAEREAEIHSAGAAAASRSWLELARLSLRCGDADATLDVSARALAAVEAPKERAFLFWLRARVHYKATQIEAAVRDSLQALELDPGIAKAAVLVAKHLRHAEDLHRAVHQLERALEAGIPRPDWTAMLWEALGRAQAGPLEDLLQAQRSYRSALASDPGRASALEALADVLAFDPAAHPECLRLHRDLLTDSPTRNASWRALERVAGHRGHRAEQATAAHALRFVSGRAPQVSEEPTRLLVDTRACEVAPVAALSDYFIALAEAERLPSPQAAEQLEPLPGVLRAALSNLAGTAWLLADARLLDLLPRPGAELPSEHTELPRRLRRRIQRAERVLQGVPNSGALLASWRAETLARAAAIALEAGRISLPAAADALVACWPEGRDSTDLADPAQLARAVVECPPLRSLMLRMVDGVCAALGVAPRTA